MMTREQVINDEGFDARVRCEPLDSCPHTGDDAKLWRGGWWNADDGLLQVDPDSVNDFEENPNGCAAAPFDFDAWWAAREAEQAARETAMKTSPVTAHAAGVSYCGSEMPDKGQRDGSCNRTACQLPLAGQPQWFMIDCMTDGRLYYCQGCAEKFHESDRQSGRRFRCTLDTDG